MEIPLGGDVVGVKLVDPHLFAQIRDERQGKTGRRKENCPLPESPICDSIVRIELPLSLNSRVCCQHLQLNVNRNTYSKTPASVLWKLL
jgi:hypothetical protein